MKIFLSDLDGTLVSKDMLDVVCGIIGKEKESSRLCEDFFAGKIAGLEALKMRIDFLKGVTSEQIKEKLDAENFLTKGAEELFALLKRKGFITVLHTGNILPVAQYYQKLLGIDHVVCVHPRMDGTVIQGIELEDFPGADFKADGCKKIIEQYGTAKENVWAIGDSMVDLPTFGLAGTRITIHAKHEIEKHADIVLTSGKLTELIPYLQKEIL